MADLPSNLMVELTAEFTAQGIEVEQNDAAPENPPDESEEVHEEVNDE